MNRRHGGQSKSSSKNFPAEAMTSSTIRTNVDATFEMPKDIQHSIDLRKRIWAQWIQRGAPDMVGTLREHPHLLEHQSLLMELVIDEYESRSAGSSSVDLAVHCDRFREFGSGIFHSIKKQLEVQQHLAGQLRDAEWPSVGDDFGGFRIVEQLGRGASARVYLCLEKELGCRLVVVKVSPMLSFEASILGRLEHPNITPIYSAGEVEELDLNYLCMPFLGRSTLTDLVDVAFRDGCPRTAFAFAEAANRWHPKDPAAPNGKRRLVAKLQLDTYVDRVLQMAIQIADALALAHERGIVHGDLKPSNVLLTPSGAPMLVDFNLSQDLSDARRSCGGTLPYMPPEHLRILQNFVDEDGEPAATPASDIYSFGALLFELLSGINPIGGFEMSDDPSNDAGRILERLKSSRPNVVDRNPLVSRNLNEVVLRCMSFEPADRFASMQDVKRALEAEKRSPRTLVRKARVRPLMFSLLIGLPALATIGGAGYAFTRPPASVRHYEQGMELLRQDRPGEAAVLLASSVSENPSFSTARFELARARMAAGDVDLAIGDFAFLDKQEQHLPSVAYLAYCFSITQRATPAIVVYERAVRSGLTTLAVYNNLGASYLDGSNTLTPAARLQLAESTLQKALALDSTSTPVHLNFVRLAVRRSNLNLKYDPFDSWPHASAVLCKKPTSEIARLHIAMWWSIVRERHSFESSSTQRQPTKELTEEASFSRQEFDSLYEVMAPKLKGGPVTLPDQSLRRRRSDCLIEPRS